MRETFDDGVKDSVNEIPLTSRSPPEILNRRIFKHQVIGETSGLAFPEDI